MQQRERQTIHSHFCSEGWDSIKFNAKQVSSPQKGGLSEGEEREAGSWVPRTLVAKQTWGGCEPWGPLGRSGKLSLQASMSVVCSLTRV
jgi:hypothetical protein